MAGYQPLKVVAYETGLVQSREEFILANDAYPTLENAFIWRERIKRKQGFQLLGRLQRNFSQATSNYSTIIGTNTYSIFSELGITDPNATIVPGNLSTITIIFAGGISQVLTDSTGSGTFVITGAGPITSATINYLTGIVSITANAAVGPVGSSFSGSYNPNYPVMGLRTREISNVNNEQMVAFDQVYAYKFSGGSFQEFLPGTTWTGSDSQFFWSTNYWVGDGQLKIFWVNNDKDPIRYTNGQPATNWVDFTPQINAAGGLLLNALCILPFRGRLVVFNTTETDGVHTNRIRWAAIGNPFTIVSPIVSTVSVNAWRDDIRGKGGFLDIPTNESIITVGFVRDNLVVYCERSTWQLRYTGRSIAPFQIEKVNSELGVESTFSGVQFDTSLVGIGDKGIVECDSFKSTRIDIKIVDLVVQQISNKNQGTARVHGLRDFQQKLAFWIYPNTKSNGIYPDRRLVYNYENNSWSIFTDSLTVLGTFQNQTSRKWSDQPTFPWKEANFSWLDRPALFPNIMGGNQQGFVLYLDKQTSNQESLYIQNITGNTTTSTTITSPSHNLQTGNVIKIIDIPAGTPFSTSLNGMIFEIDRQGPDSFNLYKYSAATGQFSDPQTDAPATYIGGGLIQVRDNFNIVSKKFNYMDDGKQFQLGYVDVLFEYSPEGAVTFNVYNDYEMGVTSNTLPMNAYNDTFFNSTVETTSATGVNGGTKNWKRVFCPTNSNFITLEWTLSNAQMNGVEQESDVQIDAQTIWSRVGGRLGITN